MTSELPITELKFFNVYGGQLQKHIQYQYLITNHFLKGIYSLTLYRNEAHYFCLTRLYTQLSE